MKRIVSFCIVLFVTIVSLGQNKRCFSSDITQRRAANDPNYQLELSQANDWLGTYVRQSHASPRSISVIPVVVHVVYNTPDQNIPTAYINNMISTLNADFTFSNSDTGDVRTAFKSVRGNAQISFCLANIIRKSTSVNCFDPNTSSDEMKHASTGGSDSYDPSHYLNIWICALCGSAVGIGGIDGYTLPPTVGTAGSGDDGTVLQYDLAFQNQGNDRTATHEIGHYLGLQHTWGGGSLGTGCGDDSIPDTPITDGTQGGCSMNVACTASPGSQYENFMDYADCRYMFTIDQATVMNGILTGTRASLLSSPGCNAFPPVTDFAATPIENTTGGSITFNDQTINFPTTWSWSFPGGTPSSSNLQNPIITYNAEGTYDVKLVAANAFGRDSITKTGYITISNCTTVSDQFAQNPGIWNAPGGGYLCGNNSHQDLALGQLFMNNYPGRVITSVYIAFAKASYTLATDSITVFVDTTDVAGNAASYLASQKIAIKDIAVDIQNHSDTHVTFSQAAMPSSYFIVGFTIPSIAGDTVVVYSDVNTSTNALEQKSNGIWYSYADTASWNSAVTNFIAVEQCIPSCNGFTATTTGVPSSCTLSNGVAIAQVNGTTPPYLFHWNTGAITDTITGLAAGTYNVTITDSTGCYLIKSYTVGSGTLTASSSFVAASCGGNDGIAIVSALGGTTPYHYSWNTVPLQTGDSAINLYAGNYEVTISDAAGCSQTLAVTITQPCDSVWPGDVDDNGIADFDDAMWLSYMYGLNGPSRPNASLVWSGQPAPNWPGNSLGVNDHHSDTNGDGTVDVNDTLAITLNYGLTHQKTGPTPRATDPIISYVPVTDTIYTNQDFHIKVMLGSQSNPVDSLMALAFSMNLDPAIFDTTGAQLNFNNSWLGTIGTNAFSFRKPLPTAGKIDMVLARKDHHNASGYGQIGEIILHTQNHLPGNIASSSLNLVPGVIKGITSTGTTKTYNTQSTTVTIKDTTTGIANLAFDQIINVYPNPSNGHFVLSINQASRLLNIELLNVESQVLYAEQLKETSSFKKEFNLSDYAKGIYFLKVSSENGAVVKRVVVQ